MHWWAGTRDKGGVLGRVETRRGIDFATLFITSAWTSIRLTMVPPRLAWGSWGPSPSYVLWRITQFYSDAVSFYGFLFSFPYRGFVFLPSFPFRFPVRLTGWLAGAGDKNSQCSLWEKAFSCCSFYVSTLRCLRWMMRFLRVQPACIFLCI